MNRIPLNRKPTQKLLRQNEFEGTIRIVTYENDEGSFKIVRFVTEDGEFSASGNLFGTTKGDQLRIKGEWFEHPKHGFTFKIESFLLKTPETEEGLIAYLGSGLIRGVGPRTAEQIVERFGKHTINVLDETPELLEEIKGISRKKAREVASTWAEHRASREALTFMKEHGLTTAMSMRLLNHYGDNVVAILRTDPYRVGLEVPLIGFLKADEIAERLGVEKESPLRLRAALVHVLDRASSDGHTYLPRSMMIDEGEKLLQADRSRIESALDEAVVTKLITAVTDLEDEVCYFMPSLYRSETGCADRLIYLSRQARPLVTAHVDSRIKNFEDEYRFRLAPKQQDAIRSAMSGGVCVITGGPGTGKTTLVRALLWVLQDSKCTFSLCSPTGRAAQRLSETTGKDASTVHRLLKWNAQTGRFSHNDENPLDTNLLIVDEASMLDIPLAFHLLRALKGGTTVVFVGDVDQLPSVGPGKFLKDVINSGTAKVTRLEVIFRQGKESMIVTNSHRINEGITLRLDDQKKDADFFFVERKDPEAIYDALTKMATDRIPKKLGCDPVDDIQILAPMRRGPLGTHELNRLMQTLLNPDGKPIHNTLPFRMGDKVIQTSNNYDLDVYNGDVGRIDGIHPETRSIRIRFGKRDVYYPPDSLNDLELAYAVTIHKSQGSEYPAVIVILHSSHYIMLKRNLIYTAVTRGKKLVLVLGAKTAMMRAIKTSTEGDRKTALATWLRHPAAQGDLIG